MGKNRAFTAAVIVSLAIGIGANTTMFSVANAVLLRALPYKDAGRLVILWNRSPGLNIAEDWFSTAQYFDIKSAKSFEQAAIAIGGNENLTGGRQPERVGAIHISSNLLPMLGVRVALGRLFGAEEDQRGGPNSALLSDGMWERRFSRDANVLGRSLELNGKVYQVVGVLPRNFSLPREVLPTLGGAEQAEILLPLPLGPDAANIRGHEDYNVIAKLNRGVTARQAQAEMDALTQRLRRDFPANYPPNGGLTFGVVPLQEQVAGDIRTALLVLAGAVGLVLLIACANVANLLLSRADVRQREVAVRMALGASTGRVIRQLLTESVVLALAGGALSLLLAAGGVQTIRILGPRIVPRLPEIALDLRVLLFAVEISLLSGLLFGLAPALRVRRLDVQTSLKSSGRNSAGTSSLWGRGHRMRKMLVLSEMALSVVLLVGAGLLIRSFLRLRGVSAGFDPKNVLTFELTMTGRRYDSAAPILESYRQIIDKLEKTPGVSAAGAVSSLPLSQMFAWGPIVVEGRVPAPGENFMNADERIVAGHYFEAMRIPLISGRLFTEQDNSTNPRVALVDEFMARELWPNQNAVGKRFRLAEGKSKDVWITVVGVVGRVKQYGLESDSRIALYLFQSQYPTREMNVVLRSEIENRSLANAAIRTVSSVDADLPVYHVRTMDARVSESLARRRFTMALLGAFAIFALALATVGVYGVVSYIVSQGTRELGIRVALGASEGNILSLVIRQGLYLALSGIAVGACASLAIARLLRSLLFGVGPADPATFWGVGLMLAMIAGVASYVPAKRATRVDPCNSLRWE